MTVLTQALAAARSSTFFLTFLMGVLGGLDTPASETPGNSPSFQCRFFGGGAALTAALPAAEEEVGEGELLEAPAFLVREPRAQHGTREKPSDSLVLGSPGEVRQRGGEAKEERDHKEAMAWSELEVGRARGMGAILR